MSNVWILVCDAARARLFETSGRRGAWTELACYANPELRMPPAALGTGRTVPRVHDSTGAARHAIEPRVSRKDRSASVFAHHIATELLRANAHKRYDRLLLVAPPRFLGMLRDEIGDLDAAGVAGTLDSDVVGMAMDELVAHVRQGFPQDFLPEAARAVPGTR